MRKVDASAKRALARLFWVVTWFAQRLNDHQPFAGNHYRLAGVYKWHWRPVSNCHPCGSYRSSESWLPRTLSVRGAEDRRGGCEDGQTKYGRCASLRLIRSAGWLSAGRSNRKCGRVQGRSSFSFPVVIPRFLEAAKHLGGSREI